MINCNPETVSTDYDTSDRLYFEPLTAEDVIEIIDTERRNGTLHGVIVQFGGQTPLKLAEPLEKAKVPILGTSPDAIDLAEDRDRFKQLLDRLKLRQPKSGIATSPEKARADRRLDRLSDRDPAVLCARRPRHGDRARRRPSSTAMSRGSPPTSTGRPSSRCRRSGRCLIDRYLTDAVEVDVDCLADGKDSLHRRHHGAHRGGRHPFRRLRLLAAAAQSFGRDHRRARPADPRARAGAQGRRPDERAIRHQGRRHLRARGQSARLAHGAVRRQGDRHPGRQDRGAHHGRRIAGELQAEAAELRIRRRPSYRRQGGGFSFRPLRRRRSTPCSGRR